jgi:hypothetical protein
MRAFGHSLLLLLLTASLAHAQTLRPTIASVSPSGGQRGTTVTVTLTGINLGYGTHLILPGAGLTVETLTPEPPPANAKNPEGKIVAGIKIAPDAPLGRHALRVLTPFGPSEVGYLVVGEWPEIAEKEPNGTRGQAQSLTGPVTVVGHSDPAEDVDVFRVTLRKGETTVFAAAAGGIDSPLAPVLTLQDATGHEVGFAAALSQPDARLTFTAPRAGDYFLLLRDLRYQGGPAFHYRLTVGRVPAVTSVFPLGGPAGETARLTLTGVNLPTPPERAIPLPTEPPFAPLPLPDAGDLRLEVGTLPETAEAEPNDSADAAQRVTPPVTINGRLYSPAAPKKPDVDCFRFAAAKGQVFTLAVVAARLGSPLAAVLSVLDARGKELAANDGANGPDPALTFTAPEAGEYIARVRDVAGRSGESFGYRLHVAPAVPDFSLAFSPDCLAVAPGDRVPFTVTVNRQNGFDGEIALTFDGLPAGLRLIGVPVIGKSQGAVALLAAADAGAAPVASPLRVTGTATIGGKPVARRAVSREQHYVKRDDRVEETTRPVPLPFAAVTGPPDLTVTTATDHLTLVAGKTAPLTVSVQRKAGFTAKIPLIVQGLPTGVSVDGAEIPENKTEATLTLKAEGNAAVGSATLTILGRSLVDELHFTDHATLPVTLTVTK